MIYREMQQASWKIRDNNGEKSQKDFFLKKELRIALSRKYNPVERSVMILCSGNVCETLPVPPNISQRKEVSSKLTEEGNNFRKHIE